MTIPVLISVFVASLLGSLHCAGMCGPIVAFCAGTTAGGRGSSWGVLAAYSLGRLVTYALLGAAAGGLGAAIDLAGTSSGLGRLAAVIAGVLMTLWGVVLLFDALGRPLVGPRVPPSLQAASARLIRRAMDRPPLARAALLGLSSTLLPCGWLYAFALTAAGTGSVLGGASLMAAFWAGSVPLLFGVGLGVRAFARSVRRHVPVLSALALIALGLYGVFGRMSIPAFAGRIAAGGLAGVGAGIEGHGCECTGR